MRVMLLCVGFDCDSQVMGFTMGSSKNVFASLVAAGKSDNVTQTPTHLQLTSVMSIRLLGVGHVHVPRLQKQRDYHDRWSGPTAFVPTS